MSGRGEFVAASACVYNYTLGPIERFSREER